jgi:hypothetical protein
MGAFLVPPLIGLSVGEARFQTDIPLWGKEGRVSMCKISALGVEKLGFPKGLTGFLKKSNIKYSKSRPFFFPGQEGEKSSCPTEFFGTCFKA